MQQKKFNFCYRLGLTMAFLTAHTASGQNMTQLQQHMLLQMAEQSGLLQQAVRCSGISSSKLKQHLASALQQCPLQADGMPAEQCVKTKVIQSSGVSQAALQQCEQLAAQARQQQRR